MKRVLFIDRDGTILKEPPDEQIDSFDKMEFLPGVISGLRKVGRQTDFELVMVTNQDGLGTAVFPEETFWPVHHLMMRILEGEDIRFEDIHIDRSLPEENAPTRKPRTGLLTSYLEGEYDLANSFVIGDRLTDIELAGNLGARAIYLGKTSDPRAVLSTSDWSEISAYLCSLSRRAVISRKTGETSVAMEIRLDGSGRGDIHSGLGFLNHMLELFARHSGIDVSARIEGDLHVDEHHTVEDTAIVLGQAVSEALGDKRGLVRYGFLLPMDESRAVAAVDFSGRSHLVWKVKFRRERIGDVPTELFEHFFKTFCDHARCNLYVRAKGENEHHKIEAVFKAFARAIRAAVQRMDDHEMIPSTKGLL